MRALRGALQSSAKRSLEDKSPGDIAGGSAVLADLGFGEDEIAVIQSYTGEVLSTSQN